MTNGKAEAVFLKGKVVTLDSSDKIASAVAIGAGRVLAEGTDEEIRKLSDPAT